MGIGSRDSAARLEDFVDEHDLRGFPNVADESGELRGRLGVRGQPTWIFVAADGTTERVFGVLGQNGLVERLDELVA
ncbi:MAG TPA: hypothetical protein VM933_09355 [Acidimicrobiales bacterium]|nr:hypothetical protein [Acidimicrobiales bacterium]